MPDPIVPMKGAVLKYTVVSTKTRIPGITSIDDIVKLENPMIENTALDGTNVTNQSGTPDYGDLTFKFNWDPANSVHQALLTRAQAGTEGVFTVFFPNTDASELEITGPFKTWSLAGGDKGARGVVSCSVKINSFTLTP